MGIKTEKGGHLLDQLKSLNIDSAKVKSSIFGNEISFDKRELSKQTTGKLRSDYWLKKIQNGERPVILVDVENGKMIVVDGNHKLTAYKELGIEDIPTVFTNKAKSQLIDIWNKANGKLSPLEQEAKKYKSADEFVKAQGTPVYHGTKNEIIGEIKIGSNKENPATGLGFFTTKDKKLASEYGDVNEIYFSEKPRTAIIPETKTTDDSRSALWKFVVKDNFGTDFPSSEELSKFKDKIFGKYSDINYGTSAENAKARVLSLKKYLLGKGYNSIEMSTGFKNGTGRSLVIIKPEIVKTKKQLIETWNKANKK